MTSSVLLTAPSTLDVAADSLNADRAKRNVSLPPFGVIVTSPLACALGPSTSTTPISTSNAYDSSDASASEYGHPTLPAARQWTGAPIRAIVPLPRRKHASPASTSAQDTTSSTPRSMSVAAHLTNVPVMIGGGGPAPCLTRPARVAQFQWDDADSDGSEAGIVEDDDDEDEELEKVRIKGRNHASSAWCCSYESITAVEGLSAWSFEELRLECYAQSLVARGTKPPPVSQHSLAIPPAFVPRIIPRN